MFSYRWVAPLLLVAGCTVAPTPLPDPGPGAAPETGPAPPRACLIDPAALAAATGVGWTPDATTATDARCVYDPADADPAQFVVVTVEPETDPDVVMQVCAEDDAPLLLTDGFVCRLDGGGVFAAGRFLGRTVTFAAASPVGEPERLTQAFAEELARLPA